MTQPTQLDYSILKKELLIAIRGDLSQKQMSEKLGFKFNQYHKWESDLKWLRWDEFIDILKAANISYKKAFQTVFAYRDDPRNVQQLFEALCADLTLKEIGLLVGHHEPIVRRWITKNISPSLETIFKLINERTNNLYEFIHQLTDIENVPTLKLKYQETLAQKKVEAQFPFASAIEAALQLEDYKKLNKHSDKWISDRILVSEDLVKKAIVALVNANTISQENNKFIVHNKWITIPGLPLSEAVKIDHYWTKRCLDRYQGKNRIPHSPAPELNTNLRAFRVAAMSEKAAFKIQKLLRKTNYELLKIIQEDCDSPKKIGVYVNHFFDVQDIKWIKTNSLDDEE